MIMVAGIIGAPFAAQANTVNYNFQVRPILAEHCFKCHGQDEKQRKAKLRLDDRAGALAKKAFVPGNPDASELIKRIVTHDEDELMPPPKEHRPVTPDELALLKQWIAEGALFEKHWAFIPPVRPPVPAVQDPSAAVLNSIDAFVLARLEKEHLRPAAPAAREEWLRRVTLDLTGLPPSLAEVDAFLNDESTAAFSHVVERLLASPAYGQRMASEWLDAARFADTYGRHEDEDCETWPYRDWVVRAFNKNLPYNKFVLWQTAGDMLPGATREMYLATAFNRLVQQSNESGSNEEEFRCEHVADRIRTNGIALLGLSIECARCHDHKYDPITQRDYYSMSAFLNNIDELGLYSRFTDAIPAPSMFLYEGDQEQRHMDAKMAIVAREAELQAMLPEAKKRFATWLAAPHVAPQLPKPLAHLEFEELDDKSLVNSADKSKPASARLKTHIVEGHSGKGLYLKTDNAITVPDVGDYKRTHPFSTGIWLKMTVAQDRAVVIHHSRSGLDAASRGYEVILEDMRPSFALCHFWPGNGVRVRARQQIPVNQWVHLAVSYDGSSRASGMKIYVDGQLEDCEVVADHLYKDITYDAAHAGKDRVQEDHLGIGGRYNDRSLKETTVDDFKFFDRELSPVEMRLMADSGAKNKPDDWFGWYLREVDEPWRAVQRELQNLRDTENKISSEVREIMVMKEMPGHRRPTFVLTRGRFDAPAARVEPDMPASVLPFPKEYPRNRLGYGEWLVDPRNPLTARVFVNRVWQMFFGRGIVLTSEDFGIQGQLPTHPELLDWLAVWFMDHGWDVKELCRLIALSGTYRQSSMPTKAELLTDDPDNKLLARGPRQRLTAEQLRDSVLALSGLLSDTMGGEPVKPYQPANLWEESGTQHEYTQDHGEKLFRRSLYTFWRRTLPPPSMTIFDAPTREFCKARRDRSSSPLQPLVLFDDPQFVEAARVLAEKLLKAHPDDDAARVREAFRTITCKQPSAWQVTTLQTLLADEREQFKNEPEQATVLRKEMGEAHVDESLDPVEVAATTILIRALLGYDEFVMKP